MIVFAAFPFVLVEHNYRLVPVWDETGKLTASDAAGFDNFGVSVAIRDDERT